MTDLQLQDAAEQALALMRRQGFDHAQVSAGCTTQTELNLGHNRPTLLRSTEAHPLALTGVVDGRRASTEVASLLPEAMVEAVRGLFDDASSAPQDAANAVSEGQQLRFEQGPRDADPDLLADTLAQLLDFRARETPTVLLEEGNVAHVLRRAHTLTSAGSDIACRLGWYGLTTMGTAREGGKSSSFNYVEGATHDLRACPAHEHFGIGDMLRDTARQVHTQPLGSKFVGEVVLTPQAVTSLLGWLLGQLSDPSLIGGSSIYRERVGDAVASPLINLSSRFEAPGVAPVSGDAFVAAPVRVLAEGRLQCLLPTLYGSRKTGLKHVPTAGGWEIAGGDTSVNELVSGVRQGAIVGRLSMGNPAPNGDFSGVIKNSFLIEGGVQGPPLSEAMISGNIAQMLQAVEGVSRERIDTGATCLPWVRIGGLHFS